MRKTLLSCQRAAQHPLAADATGVAGTPGVCFSAVTCRRAPRSREPASGAAEAWRWAVPQPQRGPAMRVARHQGCGVGAGSRRRNVGCSSTAALGGRRRLRGARRAGLGTPAVSPRPRAPIAVGARPPPRCQPSRPTSLAADTAGAALNLGVFERAVACRRAPRSREAASGAAEAGVGRSLSPSVVRPCAWHAARAAAWGPDRAAVTWDARERCVGRAPSVAWGAAGRTRYACRYRRAHARMCRGRPPAAPLPMPPPNRARSRHRWRGP